jgi:hypothetical protein
MAMPPGSGAKTQNKRMVGNDPNKTASAKAVSHKGTSTNIETGEQSHRKCIDSFDRCAWTAPQTREIVTPCPDFAKLI